MRKDNTFNNFFKSHDQLNLVNSDNVHSHDSATHNSSHYKNEYNVNHMLFTETNHAHQIKDYQIKNMELLTEIEHLKEQLDICKGSPEKMSISNDRRKETYDMKFVAFNVNLHNVWDLTDQKIAIYESR